MQDEGLQTQPEIETKTVQTSIKNSGNTLRESSNNNAGIIIALLIAMIVAIAGVILGATGLIKANQALNILKSNDIETIEDDEELVNENDEDSDYVTISYNGGVDYIDIYDGNIDYYAIDENDEVDNENVETDTTQIIETVKNNLNNLKADGELPDKYDWSIEVSTIDNYYVASGEGEAPEWFTNILNQLNLDAHGYKSTK